MVVQPETIRARDKAAREWEEKLARDGLAAELEPDPMIFGDTDKEAKGADEKKIRDEIYNYYIFGARSRHGEHLQAIQDIEARLGLPHGTIDEGIMKEIDDETGEIFMALQQTLQEKIAKNARISSNARRANNVLIQHARKRFEHVPEDVLEEIVSQVVSRVISIR